MSDTRDPTKFKTGRTVGILFGVFFLALALVILFTSNTSNRVGAIIAAIAIGGLGFDLLVSALRGKRSLLARIGPLP